MRNDKKISTIIYLNIFPNKIPWIPIGEYPFYHTKKYDKSSSILFLALLFLQDQ